METGENLKIQISPKEDVIRFVQSLPDDVSYEEIQRKIAFLITVRESREAKPAGTKTPKEEPKM